MPPIDFTDSEKAALAALLRAEIKNTRWPLAPRTKALIAELKRTIASDPFPLSTRVRELRVILAKLHPPPPRPQPYPAP